MGRSTDRLSLSLATIAMGMRQVRALRSPPRTGNDDHDEDHDEENTYGLPEGGDLSAELRAWFDRQRQAVEAAIPDMGPLPSRFPDLAGDDWTDPMKTAMTPMIGGYWEDSYRSVGTRLGLDTDHWEVVSPHLRPQIARQTFSFCDSTNRTTKKRLGDALDELRAAFSAGMVDEGESLTQLRKRVRNIFEGMSREKANQIAATEASRAVHAAELHADQDSGVVAGLELLLSSDACPLCRKIATECPRVRLGDAFATIGHHTEYKTIRHPPLHPSCQCTIIEVLKLEYGGPENPKWGTTLDQPTNDPDYKPPKGKKTPAPAPEKAANPPAPTKPEIVFPLPEPAPKPPPKALPPLLGEEATPAERLIRRAERQAARHDIPVQVVGAKETAKIGNIPMSRAARVDAFYNPNNGTIYINKDSAVWNDPENIKRAAASKWYSSSDPLHVITHEIGHAEHDRTTTDDEYTAAREKKFSGNLKALISKHVSRYGATSGTEFVAEAYAGMEAGAVYPEELMDLYRKLKGPGLK